MRQWTLSPPLRVVLIYATVAMLWILFTDRLLEQVVVSTAQLAYLQLVKGGAFVIVTSILFYVLSSRDWRRLKHQNDELATLKRELEQRVAERTAELEAANARLQELDRLKSKLIADISHELRGPITSLSLRLEMMERMSAERRQEAVAGLKSLVAQLRELVEDVLDFSRLEDSRGRLEFAPVSVNEVVQEAFEAHLPVAEAAGLRLSLDSEPVPPVWGRRNQLARVISNLIANAIKYTSEGQVQVRLAFDPQRQMVMFQVRDTGIGIDPSDRPHLFNRFYRSKRVKDLDIPGSGLGLAIVKEIVDAHWGRIELDSQIGEGSTFRVWLPLAGKEREAGDSALSVLSRDGWRGTDSALG